MLWVPMVKRCMTLSTFESIVAVIRSIPVQRVCDQSDAFQSLRVQAKRIKKLVKHGVKQPSRKLLASGTASAMDRNLVKAF